MGRLFRQADLHFSKKDNKNKKKLNEETQHKDFISYIFMTILQPQNRYCNYNNYMKWMQSTLTLLIVEYRRGLWNSFFYFLLDLISELKNKLIETWLNVSIFRYSFFCYQELVAQRQFKESIRSMNQTKEHTTFGSFSNINK